MADCTVLPCNGTFYSNLHVFSNTYSYTSTIIDTLCLYIYLNTHISNANIFLCNNYIPRRKSGIYWIQVRRAAAAVEISLWTR